MGDWGKIGGTLIQSGEPFSMLAGYFIGSAVEDAVSGNKSPTPASPTLNAPPVDNTESENQLKTAQIQADVMAFGIQESSRTSQFQTLAWVTERLDSEATKLQTAELNAKVQFAQESNRHIEKMTEYRNLFASRENYGGLPPPNEIE
jgi:hypothetical protein